MTAARVRAKPPSTLVRESRSRLRLGGRKWPELTDAEQIAVLDWIVDLCVIYGAEHATAYRVAAEFAAGMQRTHAGQ